MCKSIVPVAAAMITVTFTFGNLSRGQNTTAGDTKSAKESEKRFQKHAGEQAAAFEIRVDSSSGRKLVLQREPILRWTNPVPEKQMHGDVFLWTDDNRPAAVLCLFEMNEDGIFREYREFTSLAAGSLVTTSATSHRWSPATSQLNMAPLPDAPPPAPMQRQRLSQMRELAARFSCEKTTRMNETHTLRLLSSPIARYESRVHEVSDGALFAFVEATDPEVFLMLEARQAGGELRWHYGLTRMVSVRTQVSYNDKPIWDVETLPFEGYRNRPELPYTLLLVR